MVYFISSNFNSLQFDIYAWFPFALNCTVILKLVLISALNSFVASTKDLLQKKEVEKSNENPAVKEVEKAPTSSQRCNGRTKKGKPCKRTTKSSNGYCWQHGGN